MARVTVEDCIDKVHDRFELVAIAAQRAKNIAGGAPLTIDRNEEKDTVIALREIGLDNVSVEELRKDLVKSHQRERSFEDDMVEDDPVGSLQQGMSADEIEAVRKMEAEVALADDEADSKIVTDAPESDNLDFSDENVEVDD